MLRNIFMNIKETMEYLGEFSKLGKPVADLSRFRRIMAALGDPQDKLKFVHIAGTNGKGSTVRMTAGALTAAGYKTGEFTSPYIHVYNDRIRIDGENIPDEALCSILTDIRPTLDGLDEGCSQFEISTAVAFIYFLRQKCDIVVLEAGLGGLLDCTNIIAPPELSVITSISLDHTKILGDTIDKIARQKAGIIKSGSPVVLSCRQDNAAYDVISQAAENVGSEFCTPDISQLEIIRYDHTGNIFRYKGRQYETSMVGKHQIENALTAIEAADILRRRGWDKLDSNAVYSGIKNAAVPSRCQIIQKDKPFILIDGAHNPDGMRALAEFVSTIPKSPKIMVCGMMENKDWRRALEHITPYIDRCICVDGFAPKTVPAPKLAEMFAEHEYAHAENAVDRAAALAGEKGMVLIAGSLYLAAALGNLP